MGFCWWQSGNDFTWVVIVEELRILWTLETRDALTVFYRHTNRNLIVLSQAMGRHARGCPTDACDDGSNTDMRSKDMHTGTK